MTAAGGRNCPPILERRGDVKLQRLRQYGLAESCDKGQGDASG